jgi:hypothetical protein
LQEKYDEVKRKDASRKKMQRMVMKDEFDKHPREYSAVKEQIRGNTAARVRKHRQQKKVENQGSPKTPNPQQSSRRREKHRDLHRQHLFQEKETQETNKLRVRNFRLRIKLTTPASRSPNGYQHKRSESRAYIRVKSTMPTTSVKKVRIIERLLENTTPKSRQALGHSRKVYSLLNTLTTRRNLSTQYAVIESIKHNLESVTSSGKRPTSAKLAASKLLRKSRSVAATARLLGVSRKSLAKHSKDETSVRKVRKHKVSDNVAERVNNFFLEDVSRQMPNKRDVLLVKGPDGEKVLTQKHIIEVTPSEAFTKFQENNPDVKIGKTKFDSLKPHQVRKTNISNISVCCCIYCENVRHKLQIFNRVTEDQQSMTSPKLLYSTMCDKTGPYHAHKCIHRQCENCGTRLLGDKCAELLQSKGETTVTWKEWENKRVPLDAERFVSRVVLVTHEDTLCNFFATFVSALEPHSEHVFRAAWQYDQFRENVNNISEGEIVMAMDFSENYTCRYGREIQSVHWNQKQITLHPMMLYYKKDEELHKDGFTIISDDLKHDSQAVSAFEKAAVQHLRESGVEVNTIY